MKAIIIIILIVFTTQTQIVLTQNKCQCVQLTYKNDCYLREDCQWIDSICQKKVATPNIITPQYCQTAKSCTSTWGCQYVDGYCTFFTTCTAFIFKTHQICGGISIQCTTNGQQCISKRDCTTYDKATCQQGMGLLGKCKWIDKCYNPVCSDESFKTDAECSNFIPGCISNGRYCLEKLLPCNQYYGNEWICGLMIGTDGKCNGSKSLQCKARQCQESPVFDTDLNCSKFQIGCITNGMQCVQQLQSCTKYQGNCLKYKGLEGPCNISSNQFCKVLECTDFITDCTKYGCFYIGGKCSANKLPCSQYNTQYCQSLTGSDGNCKLDVNNNCVPKQCEDAPISYNTNQQCAQFQTGCITSGLGCVKSLKLCSEYSGVSSTCQKYIGSDGICTSQLGSGPQNCVVRDCQLAPNSLAQQQYQCSEYSPNCVSDGYKCTSWQSCELTTLDVSCRDRKTCVWGQSCIDTNCGSQYNIILCTQQSSCFWTGTNCLNKLCTHAPISYTTNELCQSWLSTCKTNGFGCVSPNDQCGSYFGNQFTCQQFVSFNGRCWNSNNNQIGPCLQLNCSLATCANSVCLQSECLAYNQYCDFGGNQKCVNINESCYSYYGNKVFCSTKKDISGQSCNQNTDVIASCRPQKCQDAPLTNITDSQCDSFKSGCVFGGYYCVQPDQLCSDWYGSQSECKALTVGGKQCSRFSNLCRDMVCSDIQTPNLANCQASKICYFDGTNCQSPTNCNQYDVSAETNKAQVCSQFLLNGNNCVYISGDKCSNSNNCELYANSLPCTSLKVNGRYCLAGIPNCLNVSCKDQYICDSNCKFDGSVCLDIIADCTYPTTSSDNVANLLYCNRLGCGYQKDQTKCQAQNCSGYTSVTAPTPLTPPTPSTPPTPPSSDEDCLRYSSLCHYDGSTICKLKVSTCADIDLTNFALDLDKIYFCRSKQCQFSNTTKKCIDYVGCTSQVLTGLADDASKTTFCNLMGCIFTVGQTTCAVNANTGTDCTGFSTLGNNDRDKQFSCSIQTSTSTCGYNPTNSAKCVVPQQQCFNYFVYGFGYEEKLFYCQQMIGADSKRCLYVNGIRCTSFSQCTDILDPSVCTYFGCSFLDNICKSQQLLDCSLIQPFDSLNILIKQDYCSRYKGACAYKIGQQSCSTQTCNGQIGTVEFCNSIGCQFDGQFCQKSVTCESIHMYFKIGDDSNLVSEKICSQVPNCRGGNGSSCRYYCQTFYALGKNSISKQQYCQSKSEGPIQCTYVLNQAYCSPFTCSRINFAQSQSDCTSAKNTCYLDTNDHPCENKVCQENTTATNDNDCQNFMSGCVTSQLGCIDQNESCSKIDGVSDYCLSVSNGRCIYDSNYPYCLTNSCSAVNFYENIAAVYQNQSNCPKWLPNCFFYKQMCVAIQPCQNYIGDQFSCPTYQSTDGPCVGIDIEANCTARQCIDAPNNFTTDDQCKQFKPTCVTNGYGCIEKSVWRCKQALTQNVCLSNSCQWVNSCYTISTCDKYSIYGQSMCNNQTNCFWDKITIVCRQKQCNDLPSTYTTDLQCAQFDKTCVTTKAGCITKSACSTYTFSYCNGATSTDLEGKCIWSSICRPIKCEDNLTGTNDSVCDLWLKGCVSNGKSCIKKSTCDQLQQGSCIVDIQLNQCLWINGRCQQYSDCTSLIFKTYEQCQAISKFCTTDGNKCVGLSLCQYYNKGSCINGVDGKCAWAEDTQVCSLFQNCNKYQGTSLEKCLLYNQSCNFDGFGCISKSDCSSYKFNNYLCIGGGTNGKCVFDTDKGCRSFSCSDLKVDITTYDACNKQLSTCTSDGISCITLTDCGLYNQQQCIQGLKGKCKFDNNQCRYEACSDYQGDLNYCRQLKLIIPCISNGTQCINKGNCSTYSDKASCLIGGLDGDCYFTTKCALMTSCTDASKDRDSCERQPYCRYYGDQNETHCIPATCQNLQNGNLCFPAQNFNKTQYTVCQLINGTCIASQAEQLDQTSCLLNTAQTYAWNLLNNTCQSCEVLSYLPNQTNQTNQTGSLYDLALMINILYIII